MSLINEFSRIPNFLKVTESGSMTLIGNLIVTNGISASGGLTGSYSISIPGLISGSSQVLSSLPAGTISGSSQLTSSFELKGSGIVSGSTQVRTLLPAGVVSGSAQTIANLPTGVVSGSSQVDVMSTTNINKLATTGSNTFFGTQTYSGSVYIANDLIVQGSSSIQYISASSVSIGTNIVQLNTANPSIRYAGLSIVDSGSIGGSGSFLYDSVQDEFIFVHRGDGVNVTSSHFVLGPETYNSLGNETYLSNNKLPKGTGKEHLVDSNISDDGTTISLASDTVITGSLTISGSNRISFPNSKVSIGVSPTATGADSVAIGYAPSATGNNTIAIGYNPKTEAPHPSNATSNNSIAIGYNPYAGGNNSIAIGYTVNTYSANSINIGDVFFSTGSFGSSKAWVSGSFSVGASEAIEGTQLAGSISLIRSSSVSAGPLIQLAGNGRIRPASTSDRLSIEGNALYLNSVFQNNILASTILPHTNAGFDLGSASSRWGTIYTSDLSLNNGIGDWTIVEGEDDLFLYNNKKGKVYKFALTEVDPSVATPKKS